MTSTPETIAPVGQPSGVTQLAVAELWVEVLQTSAPPGPNDNFFDLGGDSIAMVTVLQRIHEELLVELPAGAILGAPSLRELSALVDAEREASADGST